MNEDREEVRVSLRGVRRWNPTHVEIGMLMEFDATGRLCHRVADILVCANGDGLKLVGFAPLEEGKVLDINVTSPLGRSLLLDHKNGSSIVDEKVHRAVKGKAQVMKDGAHV